MERVFPKVLDTKSRMFFWQWIQMNENVIIFLPIIWNSLNVFCRSVWLKIFNLSRYLWVYLNYVWYSEVYSDKETNVLLLLLRFLFSVSYIFLLTPKHCVAAYTHIIETPSGDDINFLYKSPFTNWDMQMRY